MYFFLTVLHIATPILLHFIIKLARVFLSTQNMKLNQNSKALVILPNPVVNCLLHYSSRFHQSVGQMYSDSDYSCIRDAQEYVLIEWEQVGSSLKTSSGYWPASPNVCAGICGELLESR